jgi:putative ATP-binding cassette transporter
LKRALRTIASVLGEALRLAKPYFASEERWIAIGLVAAIIALTLVGVYLNVVYTYWYKVAYNALQVKNAHAFWTSMFTYRMVKGFPYFIPGFCEIAVLTIVAGVYAFYLGQMLQIRWRRWLTTNFVRGWLSRHAYYRISLSGGEGVGLDNPDQRISDDLGSFVSSNLSLGTSLLSNIVTLLSFLGVLWAIGPPLHVGGVVVHGYLVWVAVIYSIAGTYFTQLIGRKLVPLTFQQQRVEADFRYNLVTVRQNTEQIALYGGEAEEAAGLAERFNAIYLNWWKIMKRTKALNFFSIGFTQVAVVFPIVVAAPNYFSGVFTLGVLLQIATIFGNVQGALSWFVSSYQDLVGWRATVQRLTGFERAIAEAHTQADAKELRVGRNGSALHVDDLSIALPNGNPLLDLRNVEIARGVPLAITGPSGTGKSTLFRVIAGIWPFARGRILKPDARMMFLPQRPYLPLGSLKRAVVYPHREDDISDEAVRSALTSVGLDAMVNRLRDVDNWNLRLSGGEQQRLALARGLLAAPDWLFLDEAMSALDETAAGEMYETLRLKLPRTQIVSVTHHSSVEAHQGFKLWNLERSKP